MRPKGTKAELEARRMLAARYFAEGKGPTAVAKLLGVHPGSASRWKQVYEREGKEGLRARPPKGKSSQLTPADRLRLAELLTQDAGAYGFPTPLWTLDRVGVMIERYFGIRYGPTQVWRILHSMDWSCQKPQKRVREQNAEEVVRWRRVEWPRIKKRPRRRTADRLHRRDRADAPAVRAAHLGAGRPDADHRLFATS